MPSKVLSEKQDSISTGSSSKRWSKTPGCVTIVLCQHLLLWSALYVIGSTLYILGVGAIGTSDIPPAVLLLVSSFVSLFYLCLQNTTTRLRRNARSRMQSEKVDTWQSLAMRTLEGLSFIWGVTVMLSIVFTAARQPLCSSSSDTSSSSSPLDRGATCIVDRIGLVMSWLALIVCCCLFVLLHRVNEPFRCHLLGFIREDDLLPLFLPCRKSMPQRDISDISFKCRSSKSFESATNTSAWNESTSQLLLDTPEGYHGLGISGTRRSTPSLLHPRPSLSSIRSHATLSPPPPPTSPLPPLPTYLPAKHLSQSAMHKAVYPPKPWRAYGLHPGTNSTSVRITPPSPILTSDNLASLNRSNESSNSLSSIYSRSISGEAPRPMLSSRSSSSTSTATLKRSPLRTQMTLPENVTLMPRSSSESDIDDVAALEARIRRSRLTKLSEQEGFVDRRVQSGLSSRFSYRALEVRKGGGRSYHAF